MSRRLKPQISLLVAVILLGARSREKGPSIVEFSGAQWWDGGQFVSKTFYSVQGVLTSSRPAHVGSVVSLPGKFVVPPYADAHVHNLNEDGSIESDISEDLSDGVFYAMEMDPAIELSKKVLSSVNQPTSVDVSYSQGLVTPSWGVMPDMYAMLASMGRFGERKSIAQLDTHELFIVDNLSDLANKWPALAAKYHDFIKVIIAFSEEEELRRKEPKKYRDKPPEYSAKSGVTREVLHDLVTRAHASGLRVAAHIETAADFRLALDSGVDIIAHLPASWQVGSKTGFRDGSLSHWKLTDEDARLAAEKHVVVVTTLWKPPNDPDAAKYREIYEHNLRLLKKYKVLPVIGTDMRASAPEEVQYIAGLGVFDNGTLLNMLTRLTPEAIFPKRRLGELRDGCEASFLALDASPLEDVQNITRISTRVKQGNLLVAPAAQKSP